MDLAHARDSLGGGERPLAQRRLVLLGLHVDDDVASRQRAVERVLDRVGGGMALPHGRARRDADDDVGECCPAAWRMRSRRSSTRGSSAAIAASAASWALGRDAVHQDVDVQPHQPPRRDQHEHGDEERRGRVGPG